MAFKVPTFNIQARVWHTMVPGLYPPLGPPALTPMCQLRFMRTAGVLGSAVSGTPAVCIAFPKLTDIRPSTGFLLPPGSGFSVIECPLGTGRYYRCVMVDDVARGFLNEYRLAVCVQAAYTGAAPIA